MNNNTLDENLFPRAARRFDLFDEEEISAGALVDWRSAEGGLELLYQDGSVSISPLRAGILRIAVSQEGVPEIAPSYLLVGPEDTPPPELRVSPSEAGLSAEAGELRLELSGAGDGQAVAEGTPAPGSALKIWQGQSGAALRARSEFFRWSARGTSLELEIGPETPVYGLGEKTGFLDRRGRSYRMWNSDDPLHLPDKDPLYQSIPFFLYPSGSGWVGLLLDAPGSSWFDVAESAPDRLSAAVEEKNLVAYALFGATPAELLERYTALTGRAPMPPLWSIGYHQSRHTYTPADRVREIAGSFRERKLPADVIHFDILYMDDYRVFTWNPRSFRRPGELIADLAELDFHVVTIVDPGVKVDPDYPVYAEGREMNAFCRTETGELYVGRVWPGRAVYPDFSKPEVRAWWAEQHRSLFDAGVAGIWNDMNEPADFTGDFFIRPEFTPPSEVVMDGDGRPRSMDAYHNVYGTLMSRSAREGAERYRPGKRPFVLTRAGSAGIQRYAAVWTGDNHSWWEHLAASIPMLLGMGLSGVGFVGADVGGFQESPSPELYARWMQYAIFTPFFRTHTNSISRDQEPWSFGPEVEGIARRYLELRYRLLPYIYSFFREQAQSGTPIMRPLLWEYPEDPALRNLNDQFLLGSSILVAPVTQPGVRARAVYLPSGRWEDFWTGEVHQGPGHILAEAPLDRIPLFVKAPAIIPMVPVIQSTREYATQPLELWIFGAGESGEAQFTLYEDDGDSTRYQEGEFSLYGLHWQGPAAGRPGRLRVDPLRRGYPGQRPGWRLVSSGDPASTREIGLPGVDGLDLSHPDEAG